MCDVCVQSMPVKKSYLAVSVVYQDLSDKETPNHFISKMMNEHQISHSPFGNSVINKKKNTPLLWKRYISLSIVCEFYMWQFDKVF